MDRKLIFALELLIGMSACLTVGIITLLFVSDDRLSPVLPVQPDSELVAFEGSSSDPKPGKPSTVAPSTDSVAVFRASPTIVSSAPTSGAEPARSQTAIPSLSPTPSATPSLSPTPSRTPTLTPAPVNLVSEMLAPLIQETQRRRAIRQSSDPQGYAHRIDKALNQNHINFLIYGYGTTNEPPLPPQYKGSIAIYSLDLSTLQINTVTLNHDMRAPEVERYIRNSGQAPPPTKIHWAFPKGGFDLMRLVTEDATGFSVDFQLAFQDAIVKNFVDEVLGGLSVDVPFEFAAEAIYFQNVKYPVKLYPAGRRRMNGIEVLQFIKAIQAHGVPYDAGKELAIRKQIVVKALIDEAKRETTNPLFWAKITVFLKGTLERKEIEYDFDAATLLFKSLGNYVRNAFQGQTLRASLGKSLYIVDPGSGDGGVEWITSSTNPIVVNDLKNGVYDSDRYMSVPMGSADPYAADPVANYWASVRQLIRQRIRR